MLAPKPYGLTNLRSNYARPGAEYLLGADYIGRDMLSRVIYGTRVSLSVAFVAATVSLLVGLAYGTVSGYAGGWVDNADDARRRLSLWHSGAHRRHL